MESTDIALRLTSYKRIGTTIEVQFNKLTNKLNNHEIDPRHVDERLQYLVTIWSKFLEVQ
jgi:hypothetical protein